MMEDGLTLCIGGGALTAIGGIIGAVIKAKMQKPEPQPFLIEKSHFEKYLEENERDHEAIFTRLHMCEKAVARHDGIVERIISQLDRLENKLDKLLTKGK